MGAIMYANLTQRRVPSHGFSAEPKDPKLKIVSKTPDTVVKVEAIPIGTSDAVSEESLVSEAVQAGKVYGFEALRPWTDFFHFPTGTKFTVDGPLIYDGKGSVIENSNGRLSFELHMPERDILGYKIPRADMKFDVNYTREGDGNSAEITINSSKITDPNLNIKTEGSVRKMIPSIRIQGANLDWISLKKDNAKEVDLKVKVDGKVRDFDLEI
jgi:hypothetical protein